MPFTLPRVIFLSILAIACLISLNLQIRSIWKMRKNMTVREKQLSDEVNRKRRIAIGIVVIATVCLGFGSAFLQQHGSNTVRNHIESIDRGFSVVARNAGFMI